MGLHSWGMGIQTPPLMFLRFAENSTKYTEDAIVLRIHYWLQRCIVLSWQSNSLLWSLSIVILKIVFGFISSFAGLHSITVRHDFAAFSSSFVVLFRIFKIDFYLFVLFCLVWFAREIFLQTKQISISGKRIGLGKLSFFKVVQQLSYIAHFVSLL